MNLPNIGAYTVSVRNETPPFAIIARTLTALLTSAGLLLPVAASAQQADGERLFR